MYRILFLFFLVSILCSCRESNFDDILINPDIGWFPSTPANLKELNTSFYEYDCSIKASGNRINLFYSSNSSNKGSNLDIAEATIDFNISEDGSSLELNISKASGSSSLLNQINSSANEVGALDLKSNFDDQKYFFFASDEKGQYDIKFLYQSNSTGSMQGPFEAKVLNSNVCDYYPSINPTQTKMVFSSYRNKTYDLFEIEVEGDFLNWLENGTSKAILNKNISSSGYDKCPCQNGNLLVFASDREGGFGGTDLWYSIMENGEWSNPVNFGPEINSEHNEFGPASAYFNDSKNDLLIFSSNRPGGKGGYDLYFVGIPKLIK